MENIFFSGTFGGELLSLAAANEVIDRYISSSVVRKLGIAGTRVVDKLEVMINQLKLGDVLRVSGHPSWSFLTWYSSSGFTADEIKTYFAQLMYENGVLILSTHNISLAHSEKIIDQSINIYYEVLSQVKDSLDKGNLKEKLKVEPLLPLFKVR